MICDELNFCLMQNSNQGNHIYIIYRRAIVSFLEQRLAVEMRKKRTAYSHANRQSGFTVSRNESEVG